MVEQETKYCKRWYGKLTLQTRTKLIQLTVTSVWLEFIFCKTNFEIKKYSYLNTSKINFRQLCVRSDVIFQNKKGPHVFIF